MASFDRSLGHIVVRVAFDGPSGAGKTANLRQLVQNFTPQRRSELFTPRQRGEATSYFDWMLLHGGIVGGHSLRAQLVTTPGRAVLTRRRLAIASTADVIVFVCGSTRQAVVEARRSLEILRAWLDTEGLHPPLLVQANHRDREDALPPAEVAAELGLAPDEEVAPASARTGVGIRETVVRAVRAAARLAEQRLVAVGEAGLDPVEAEGSLLARLDGTSALLVALGEPAEGGLHLPEEDAPSGWIWPSGAGRVAVGRLLRAIQDHGLEPCEAGAGEIGVRAGAWSARVATSPWTDEASAQATLLEQAQQQLRRGGVTAPETTLALAERDGRFWLWSLRQGPRHVAAVSGAASSSATADPSPWLEESAWTDAAG